MYSGPLGNSGDSPFDGDEMNMYVPLSEPVQVELLLATVYNMIISARYSTPSIVLKQDTLIGANKINESNFKIDWHDAMNYSMYIYDIDIKKLSKKDMLSYDLYSLIIPEMINYEDYIEKDGKKEIKTQIINGKITKGGIQRGSQLSTIIIYIWDKYGPIVTKKFIDNTQRLATVYLMDSGFTVGIKDCIPSTELSKTTKDYCENLDLQTKYLITEIENNPDLLRPDIFESNIRTSLNSRDYIGKVTTDSLDYTNNFYRMIYSGAKGSPVNMGCISSAATQENLKNNRIQKTVNYRTTPHFHRSDDSAEARGFVKSSYYEGYKPLETFFHHSTGREGLINTAIKTGETGYMQRRLVKALEDLKIAYDGTIRNANDLLISLVYGGTNVDPIMQKIVHLNILKMGNKEIDEKITYNESELKGKDKELNNIFRKELLEMRDIIRKNNEKATGDYMIIKDVYFQAINYKRIIHDNKNFETKTKSKLTLEYIIENINIILSHNTTPLLCLINKEENPCKYQDEQKFKTLFKLMLYEYLSPKRCIEEYKFNKEQFDNVVKEIIISYNKSLINSGEMVGVIAAQSISEPLSQLTLSSFHKTGSSSSGRQGIPRFKEIISYTKTDKVASPLTNLYLKDEYKNNKVIAKKISSYLRYTILKDIVKKVDIIYDVDPDSSLSYTYKDKVDKKNVFNTSSTNTNINKMPWLYRFELSNEALMDYDVSMLDIKISFISYWKNNYEDINNIKKKPIKDLINKIKNVCILTNNINSSQPVVHIRFDFNQVNNKLFTDMLDILVYKYNIKGSKNINRIYDILEQKYYNYNNPNQEPKELKEHVIHIEGVDLAKLLSIKVLDMTRTIINDLETTYKVYGIAAARMLIVRELTKVFENSGNNINYHHIALIADLMTSTGNITSIDRYGINKLDNDPLSRASFETSLDQLTSAAIFNEVDSMRSVSSQIMTGKPFRGGTGMCDILIDNEMLNSIEYSSALNNYIPNPIELPIDELIDSVFE